MTQVSRTITIHATADDIWQMISDFEAACKYLTGVVNCTVEGAGVGALRRLTSADGSTIVERLEALDEAARSIRYALLSDTPFRDCLTTVSVQDLGRGQCDLVWAASFWADGLPEGEALEMMEGVFELNSRALQQFIDESAP